MAQRRLSPSVTLISLNPFYSVELFLWLEVSITHRSSVQLPDVPHGPGRRQGREQDSGPSNKPH